MIEDFPFSGINNPDLEPIPKNRKIHFFCCKKLRFLQQKKWLPDF
jgi:hypothetical protein